MCFNWIKTHELPPSSCSLALTRTAQREQETKELRGQLYNGHKARACRTALIQAAGRGQDDTRRASITTCRQGLHLKKKLALDFAAALKYTAQGVRLPLWSEEGGCLPQNCGH